MKKIQNVWIPTLFILVIAGCTQNPSGPEYKKDIVVYGYLWANQPLSEQHAILISYTQPLDRFYTLDNAGIANANVTLTNETTDELFVLEDTDVKPGFYFNNSVTIQPNTTYTLEIGVDGKTVTAQTTVPPTLLQTTELRSDTVNRVSHTNLGYDKPVTLQTENDDQVIMVEMYCNEPWQTAEYIYPFHDDHKTPSDQDEYDSGKNAEPRHIMTLVPYKYTLSEEFNDEHTVFWYASMIVFYGSNTLTISAIDDNYHHYLTREHPELSGGIVGGIGVFGSLCGQKYELDVLKTD
jgi:hypothetical protein